MRRPAAARGDEEEEEGEAGEKQLHQLSLEELQGLGAVCIGEARYYGRLVQVAGRVTGAYLDGGDMFLELVATGTKDDELLRVLSGMDKKRMSVHVCKDDCPGSLTDPLLAHGRTVTEVDLKRLPWFTNLQAVGPEPVDKTPDELAALRAMHEQSRAEEKEPDVKPTKKDKKKKREEEAPPEEGRRSKSPKEAAEALEVGQKSLSSVFSHTGLDPDPVRRKRILKKAKKLGKAQKKKKKKKGSSESKAASSSSSSTSSSSSDADSGIFGEDTKLMKIWRKCPGALSSGAVREARQGLLTQAGTLWNVSTAEVPAILTQYCRQQVLHGSNISPAMTQEILTLSQTADYMLQGKIAAALDIVCQRIKSLETISNGAHWSTGRQLELIKSDRFSMSEGSEALGAAKRAREEEKLRDLLTRAPGNKGGDYSYGGKSKKGKSAGKGKPDEKGKGRGGDGRGRDDGKDAAKK